MTQGDLIGTGEDMRKAAFQVLTVALLVSLLVSYAFPILADGEPEDGDPQGVPKGPKDPKSRKPPKVRSGQRGNSNVSHLYLFEKDPDTWEIIRGRGRTRWAKIKYVLAGDEFKFILNAHGLTAEEAYSLIYYPDPWPGEGLISLGNGTANKGGNVHIAGSVDTGDLPSDIDDNYPDGAKIWLTLSDDVDFELDKMVGWNPTKYLFEYELITFDDTTLPI